MNQTILTESGLEKLTAQFQKLNEKRVETINAMKQAQEDNNCDLSENAEYLDAANELDRVEYKLNEIKEKLSNVRIIRPSDIVDDGKIKFGCTVTLLKLEDEKELVFKLVGIEESDVKAGLLSYASPLAREMMGLEEGDVVECQNIEYEIMNVKVIK